MKKKLHIYVFVGLAILFAGILAFGDIQTRFDPDDDGHELHFDDGNELVFGTGDDANLVWEDGDANANYLAIELPTGGSVNVPVLGVGIGLDDVDLGLFNGETFPGIFLMDADRDSYVALTWASDDNPEIEVGGVASTITIPGISGYTLNDDTDFSFGTSDPVDFEWTTADANANCLIIDMPAGGATDVPGFGLVTADADFGYFNGYTAPFFFIEDDDGDSWVSLEWAGDDVPSINAGGSATYVRVVTGMTFGVDDTDVDVQWFGETSGDYVLFDGSADTVEFEDITLSIMDDTLISLGDGDDWTIEYDENGTDQGRITGDTIFEDTVTVGAAKLTMTGTGATWDPAELADGAQEAKDFTVTGAALGDAAFAGAGVDVTDLLVSCTVTAADTVTVVLANETGAPVNLASSTWYVYVILDD